MKEGLQASDLVEKAIKYIDKKGDVMDLGCGAGENAVYLALKGFKVTGIDISKQFIHKSKNLAKIYDVDKDIAFLERDIVQFKYDKSYNLVISDFVFHFMGKEEIDIVIKNMKENTTNNGINAISVLKDDNSNKGFIHLFKLDELKGHYNDWEILEYGEEKGYQFIISRKVR